MSLCVFVSYVLVCLFVFGVYFCVYSCIFVCVFVCYLCICLVCSRARPPLRSPTKRELTSFLTSSHHHGQPRPSGEDMLVQQHTSMSSFHPSFGVLCLVLSLSLSLLLTLAPLLCWPHLYFSFLLLGASNSLTGTASPMWIR